jgi:23S rRNA (uridine2552-2'-O)-methyltransferase
MARSKSSARWLREHFTDEYVKRAQQDGYRSRAVYKLAGNSGKRSSAAARIDRGGFGRGAGRLVAASNTVGGGTGRVMALDILPMEPLGGR